jgi:hypothetical protein
MLSVVEEKVIHHSQAEVPKSESSDTQESIRDPDIGRTAEERAQLDKQIVRKIDLWLIPWLCLLYLLSFLDRVGPISRLHNAIVVTCRLDQYRECATGRSRG